MYNIEFKILLGDGKQIIKTIPQNKLSNGHDVYKTLLDLSKYVSYNFFYLKIINYDIEKHAINIELLYEQCTA